MSATPLSSPNPGMKFLRDRSVTDNTAIILPDEDFFSRVLAIFELKISDSIKLKLRAVIKFYVKQKKNRIVSHSFDTIFLLFDAKFDHCVKF